MAMNYIGSISILDRGDAPAQAVIDRNARSLAQRMSDETKDELNQVMSRVHNIYNAMDTVDEVYMGPSMEYLNDLAELEEILKDEIKKRQYQQQVTVFIVGYSDVCHQKLRLLQQVNEFFMENNKLIDEEDWFPTTPDMDLEEISNNVEDSLAHAHALTNRLAELNREMVDYVAALVEKKASSKGNGPEPKGKKKIEKALQLAKDEVSGLSEKLLALQKDLEDKEEKVQGLFKQLDSKSLEAQKYKTAAELGKKASEDLEILQKEIAARDSKILAQRQQLSRFEVELAQANHLKERTETKFSQSDEERQQKINMIQKELDEQKKENEETKADLTKLLDNQINAMHESHQQELEELKMQNDTETKTLQEELAALRKELNQSQHELVTLKIQQTADTPSDAPRYLDLDSEVSQQASRQSSKQPLRYKKPKPKRLTNTLESRPSTKDTRASAATSKAGGGAKSKTGGRSPTRSKDGKSAGKSSGARSDKEFAEIAIQDEGGDPASATVDEKARTPATRLGRRSKSNLAPVLEADLDSAFDLFDDQAWAAVPKDETSGRFAQYRRLSTNRMQELEEQLNLVTAKTRRKVATLKAQFQEHKGKWEAERKVLIEQVDQSIRLQGDAEKEADAAMSQLEDFITEQERLEQEEEHQRSEALQASASLTPISNAGMTPVQGRSTDHTPTSGTPLPNVQKDGAVRAAVSPDPEGELQRLMQQTDDAKSARQGESGPASAITRSSSSGSVLVGRGLLDITQPFKEPSPSPEQPSGEITSATTPVATKKSARKDDDVTGEVTIVPAPMEVSEETLNEVGLRITPENGHVAPLLVGTPREENARESVAGGRPHVASGQPLPPPPSGAEGAPVVLIVLPEKESDTPQIEADGSVHVQALIPPSLVAAATSGEVKGHDPGTILDAKVIPQREAEEEVLEEREKSVREATASSLTSHTREHSFAPDADPGERKPSGPPILQLPPSISPRDETSSSPRIPREIIGAPRRSVSELSAPVVARLDLLAMMKGRARSAGTQNLKVKPSAPSLIKHPATQISHAIQREGADVSLKPDTAVAPPAAAVGLDGIDIDVTTPRNVAQVQEMNARLGASAATTSASLSQSEQLPEVAAVPETITTEATPSPAAADVSAVSAGGAGGAAADDAPVHTADAKQHGTESPTPGKQITEASPRPTTVVAQATTIRISAQDHALSRSGTPFALKLTNRSTGEVHLLTDIIQGTVAPYPTPDPQHFGDQGLQPEGGHGKEAVATTFLNPEGLVVVTEPTSVREAALQGLTPIEIMSERVISTNLPGSRVASGTERMTLVGSGTTTPRRSPIETPTRQFSFGASLGGLGTEAAPTLSPRSSTLSSSKFGPRRSKSSSDQHHLSVVMEGGSPPREDGGAGGLQQLGDAQQSALGMLKAMMTSEEHSLKPKQLQALESMRAAVKASMALRRSASGKGERRAEREDVTQGEKGSGEGQLSPISSGSAPSSAEKLRKEKKTKKAELPEEELVARTLTVTALACQMAHEAFRLGVRPDSIFRTFSHMTPAAMLDMVDQDMAGLAATGAHPGGGDGAGRDTTSARARREGLVTRETTLASVQEVDSEVPEDDMKAEAQVNLSELKELPILDIADAVPLEAMKPTSGLVLPSEATRGSSILDALDTPMAELLEGGKQHVKLGEEKRSSGELMDDGSTLEKAQTHISEREATQGGSGSPTTDALGGSRDQTTISKQATQASIAGGGQKSFLGQSVTSLDGGKGEFVSEEDIRASSAHSRASLREQYKVKLEEAKLAAEDRRSKSPAIHLPEKMTVDDELILDDDDEDDDFFMEEGEMPLPDDVKEGLLEYRDPSMYEVGTSPPPGMKGSRDPTRLSKDNTRLSKGPQREPTGPYRDPSKPGRDPSQPLIQKIFRKGTSLLEHPLLKEYLKAYETVVGFKDGMSKMFLDKDMMSAHQMTSDLETLTFDHSQKVMPQIEELTQNVAYVLEELANLTNNILVYDREPPVSSLHLLSREPTQKSFQPVGESALSFSAPVPAAPPATLQDTTTRGGSQASSRHSEGGKPEVRGRASMDAAVDKAKISELQDQYTQLKQQLEDNGKDHQEQLQRNTVVMMEMQDTINELQRELSALGKSAKQSKSRLSSARGSAVHLKSPSPETSVMFTRLDSERNAKIMKKAVMDDKLNPDKYKEAVAKMDEYVSLPAQRLAHLVKKYLHHTRMRAIEDKVKTSSSINDEVFEVLDKMEDLQNRRARQWAERMDEMGIERLKLANLLMDTLDTIEQESGIFLIKPMYSYRGRDLKPGGPPGKLSRPIRTQQRIGTGNPRHATPTNDGASSFVPAPTPASNYRLVRHERHFLQQQQQQQVPVTMAEMRPVETRAGKDDGQVKVMGSGMTFSLGSPRGTWNMQASQPWFGKDDPANSFNTPRILELDVNRMLIGQNNITSKVPFPPSEDRLLNASNNTLRSYVTVNRPTAPLLGGERPSSGGSGKSAGRKARVSQVDKDIPEALPVPHPLPPISAIPGEEEEEEEEDRDKAEIRAPSVAFTDDGDEEEEEEDEEENTEPPHSPPGSSLYHSVVTKHGNDEDDEEEEADTKEDTTLTQE